MGLRQAPSFLWGRPSPSSKELLQRKPLVPSPAEALSPVSLSVFPLLHSPSPSAGCQQTATITMATLAPACSSTISRSQSRGREAGLISLPIELSSFKISSWLHTIGSRPSHLPGGLTSNKHKNN